MTDVLRATLLGGFGLEGHRPADLFLLRKDAGAGPKMVWVESMGIFMSSLYLGRRRGAGRSGWKGVAWGALQGLGLNWLHRYGYLRDENRQRFCMTVTDVSGRILWRYGTPGAVVKPYCSHQGQGLVAFADVNDDGRDEILAIGGPGQLLVVDSEDGRLLGQKKLPADNFSLLRVARTGDGPRGWTVLVAVSEASYEGHSYSNPTLLLDGDLSIGHEYDLPGGVGHAVEVFDADGDGFDEFLAGYTLIDHDGSVLWTAEGVAGPNSDIDAGRSHADSTVVINASDPDAWLAAVAGSDATHLLDNCGRRVWRRVGDHPQHIVCGRFRAGSRELFLFVLHVGGRAELLDLLGQQCWSGTLADNWPWGRPKPVRSENALHMGRAMVPWRDPLGCGLDLIVYYEGGWPYAIDGCGRRRVEFPCPRSAVQEEYRICRRHRPNDYGYGYRAQVADIDGDGREEVIVYDRRGVWTYGLE